MVEQIAEQPQVSVKQSRGKSSIEFPYSDLDSAVIIAQTIHDRFGARCTKDQLAAALGHGNVLSGTFNMRLSAARLFGLVETDRGEIALTQLGRWAIDPQTSGRARAEAFLKVPLYGKLYERYKGFQLPPTVGLKVDIGALGVTQKQVDNARQVFQRSAEQAGFFSMGRDRLVMPATLEAPATKPLPPGDTKRDESGKRNGGSDDGSQLHPFIRGLLQSLPQGGSPEGAGTSWPASKRKTWLQTAENIFTLLYSDDEDK